MSAGAQCLSLGEEEPAGEETGQLEVEGAILNDNK